jgi:2'-5' RNA ligase
VTRIFIAVDPPEDVRDELLAMQHGVPGARWVDDDQLHLTLRFVGDVDGAQLRDLLSALRRVSAASFELRLGSAGFFPPRGPQRVLWIGVDKSAPLDALQRSVSRAVTRLGHAPDRKKWAPHVTLARLEGAPPNRVARFVAERALYRSRAFDVDAFHVYSSQLHPKGAVYTLEESYPLDAAGDFGDWDEDEI